VLHVQRTQAELAIQQQSESCMQVYYDASITKFNVMEKLSNDNTNGFIGVYDDVTDVTDGCSSVPCSSLVCIRQGTSLYIRGHSM